MQCFSNFPVAKKFLDKGGDIKTFRRKFSFPHCRKISYGNHFVQCFRIFPVAKKFMDKGGGGSIKIFRRIIFLSQYRKISWGHPVEQCYRNFPVAKKFMDKGGGISRLSVEKIFTHSAEKLRRGILFCFTIFRYRNMLGIKEGGSIKIFRGKIFVSWCRIFRTATLLCSVSEIFR